MSLRRRCRHHRPTRLQMAKDYFNEWLGKIAGSLTSAQTYMLQRG